MNKKLLSFYLHMKYIHLILLLTLLIQSCNRTSTSNTSNIDTTSIKIDTIANTNQKQTNKHNKYSINFDYTPSENIEEDILFFENMQKTLNKKAYREFVNEYMNFPLYGDCVFYLCFGERSFDETQEKLAADLTPSVFLKNFHKIFEKPSLDIISRVNFDVWVRNSQSEEGSEKNTFEKIYPSAKVDINLSHINNEYRLIIGYNSLTGNDEDLQHATIYAFKRIEGQLKLFSIYCAG